MDEDITNRTWQGYPGLSKLAVGLLKVWPDHINYFNKSMSARNKKELIFSEELSQLILKISDGDQQNVYKSYQWTCEQLLKEEYHFRSEGKYRFTSSKEVGEFVYENSSYMEGYMRGLLLSQLLWDNHFRSMEYYRLNFLASNPKGYKHLETGPGHGLFLVCYQFLFLAHIDRL